MLNEYSDDTLIKKPAIEIFKSLEHSIILLKTRDLLLPKLMSGEVEV